jgi:uncharacterized membrane protein
VSRAVDEHGRVEACSLQGVSLEFALARFEGQGTAVESYAAAKGRSGPDAAWIQQIGFVEHHHNGRLLLRGTFAGHYLDVDENDRLAQTGAGVGAVAGGLVGALLGPAGIALGLVIGGAIGAHTGTPTDTEPEPEELAEQLRASVPRSSSAIVLIAAAADVDEMVAALGDSAKDVSRRVLTEEQEAALQASVGSAPPASSEH